MKKYLLNLLIALDQLVNAVFGGDPDETISSRVGKGRSRLSRFLARIIDAIFFWQPDHCNKSIEPDEGKDAL